ISTESAARVAGLYASSTQTTATDTTTICKFAVEELRIAPNISTSQTCAANKPVNVTASLIGPGQTVTTSPDNQLASKVAVTYTTLQLIPIPGLLKGKATLYRTVQMRIRG
ncbi:MAG TPA: hypothetical protein VG456_25415, partial [Candidatus Sulfopaludibacter sp.]|nr:hypothetical protein [Candidatus Sulfopaludibacter sp.]